MEETQIKALVEQVATSDVRTAETAWIQLRSLGASVVPYLAESYPGTKKLQGRRALVFYAISHARVSAAAFQLGLVALNDRSSIVRYRACCLLAYSLRRDAIPHLEALLLHNDQKTVADALAAIDAIKNQNHHYFMDRMHTGKTHWLVHDEDRL